MKQGKSYATQTRYVERNKRKGINRVTLAIPDNYIREIKAIANDMRNGQWRMTNDNTDTNG